MKKMYVVGSLALLIIFLMYKDLIIAWSLFLVAVLLIAIPLLFLGWYVYRTMTKNLFSPEAKIRHQEERQKRREQEAIQKEIDRPVYNKRSTWDN